MWPMAAQIVRSVKPKATTTLLLEALLLAHAGSRVDCLRLRLELLEVALLAAAHDGRVKSSGESINR